jgi:rod shape determining protein RodA
LADLSSEFGRHKPKFAERFRSVGWGLMLLIAIVIGVGGAVLYSAADGSMQPWAAKQMMRFAIAL